MNPQEKAQLEQFLDQLNSTQAGPKDSDANAMIAESAKRQPDAAYLLVQRAMGLEMALQIAQKQMAEMQTKIDQSNKAQLTGGQLNLRQHVMKHFTNKTEFR